MYEHSDNGNEQEECGGVYHEFVYVLPHAHLRDYLVAALQVHPDLRVPVIHCDQHVSVLAQLLIRKFHVGVGLEAHLLGVLKLAILLI